MSSKRSYLGLRMLPGLLGAVLGLCPTVAWSLQIAEVPLALRQDESGTGLLADVSLPGSLAGMGQIVLELSVQALGQPSAEDLLLELRLVCAAEGEEVELLSAVDLFPTGGDGVTRHVLFDLSALAAGDSLPCTMGNSTLHLLPLDERVQVLPEEGSDALLQLVRF